jgi:hypothetical protein
VPSKEGETEPNGSEQGTKPQAKAKRASLRLSTSRDKRIMDGKIDDPLYPENEWAKREHTHLRPDGGKIAVHYRENLQTGVREGFKFK